MNGIKQFKMMAQLLTVVIVLGLYLPTAWADPLAATREVIFSGTDLAKKAIELKTPAAMYEYVRNTHEYALYHGSRSNAINTYGGQRGSDVDIASVLIAMYRSQGIPARYAVSDIRAPAADVANWLGVRDIDLAKAILSDQGIQRASLSTNRQSIQFEHAWVQVQVPYDNYRGAINNSVNCATTPAQCHWIDVDPSYKLRQFHNQGIDIYGVVNFDYTRYYNAIKNDDPQYRDKGSLEIYEGQILDYLKLNFPGKTLEDVADSGVIIPVNDGLLPASLPYEVISTVSTYDAIVDHDAATGNKTWAKFLNGSFSIQAVTSGGGSISITTGIGGPHALADLSTRRLTVTYSPITVNGVADRVEIRLDGTLIATPFQSSGNLTFPLGSPFTLNVQLDGAPAIAVGKTDNVINVSYNNMVVGGYYLIGVGGDTSNWSQVHRAANQLLSANDQFKIINDTSVPPVPYVDQNGNNVIDAGEPRLLNDPLAQDALTGGLLFVAMNQYYTRFVENTRRLNALNHIISPVEGFVGIVSSTYDVDYLGNTAFSVMPGGLLIDMKGVQFNGFWRNNAPANYAGDQFLLVGHEGSSLEHEIWQEITGFDAVSTVRGIQMARAANTSLLDLKKTATVDTTPGMYTAFGFANAAQSPFAIAVRDVFNTRPTSWSHPTTLQDDGFQIIKKFPVSRTDSRLGRLIYRNNFNHGNIGCFDSQEQTVRNLITTNGGSATLTSSATLCGRFFSAGTTLNQVLSGLESEYISFFSIGTGSGFDYLDQLQGFNPAEFTFRDLLAPANIQSMFLVQTIRNDVLFGSTNGRWEYVIPARKTNTGFNVFGVYIEKVFNKTDGKLSNLSFSIANDTFTAGGGWVDGSKTLEVATSIPGTSIIQPTFNNQVFTDQSLVAQTNNDLIRTPSTADPVSTVTGNMYHDETDFTIKGRGLNFAFTRSYNSGPARAGKDGPLGFGWTHAYNMSLRSNDYGICPNCAPGTGAGKAPENGNTITASITYVDERGGEHTYLVNEATRAVTPPPGEFDSVQPLQPGAPTTGEYAVTFRNGTKYVFSGPGNLFTVPGQTARLSYIEDAYANRLTFTYDSAGRLTRVTDNLGISGRNGLTFTYSGTNTRIQSVADWAGRSWSFAYDVKGNLQSMTNPLNDVVRYTYHPGTHLLNEMILPANRGGQKAKTTFTYYRNNKAFTNANALGQGETLDYDLFRQRTRVTDPRGFIREHFYDKTSGALTQLEEPDGAVLRFANNADGLRYTKTDGLGFETQYSFQANRVVNALASNNFGRVSREIDPLNQMTDIDYGLFDQPTTTVDKRGNPVTRAYYQTTVAGTGAVRGKLKDVRATINGAPNVLLASYTYYASGAAFGQLKQKIEFIDPANLARRRITDYVYEPNGVNLSTRTVRGNTSGSAITTRFTYDTLGRVQIQTLKRRTSATDATLMSLVSLFEYDALGRMSRSTNPRGDIKETVYDANGKVAQEKMNYFQGGARLGCAAPGGFYVICTEATHTYDAADRRISTMDIFGFFSRTGFVYDAAGNLVSVTDANSHTVRYEYDSMNRRTAVIDANDNRTELTYDLGGRLIATTDANGNKTRFEYDALGQQTKAITPLGSTTRMQYDANGNVTHTTDANAMAGLQPKNTQGATVYRTYDELNRLILERDALNGDTRYRYDLLGNITSITDAEGQVTRFVYDDLGRLIETVDPRIENPDKTDRVLLYDEVGNVLLTEDRSGRQVRNTYDVLNRRILTEYLTDNTQERFTYDAFGDLVQMSNGGVTYTYTYTNRHRMASKTDSRQGLTLNWAYDLVGNLTTKTDYQGEVTDYQYDSTNRLVALRNPAYLQVSYQYDGAGRLLNRILSNGAQTDYQYDADNRLINLKNLSANRTVVEDLGYQRDNIGNITQISNTVDGKITAYTYDARYRLTGVNSTINTEDRTYSYDAVGNRKTATEKGTTYYYCYDATNCSAPPRGNRLINLRTGSLAGPLYREFQYDDAGRVVQKKDGSGKILYVLIYNGKGQVAVAFKTGFTTMGYDATDYRVRKNDRLYHLEGKNLEAVYDSTGQLLDKYLRGVVVDELVNGYHYNSATPNDWTNYTFHHDHLNSVTALTGHTGTVKVTTSYDAFGNTSLALLGTGNDLLYTGREYDRSTGLYYYRARYYDPDIGRFTSEDSLGFAAGVNFYAYCGNNPINCNDPTGLLSFKDLQNIGGAFTNVGQAFGGALKNATGAAILTSLPGVNSAVEKRLATQFFFGKGKDFFLTQGETNRLNKNPGTSEFNFGIGRLNPGPNGRIDVFDFDPQDFKVDLGNIFDPNQSIFVNRTPTGEVGTRFGNFLGETFGGEAFDVFQAPVSSLPSEVLNGAGASGGFVLYPGKPNTNMLNRVYSK